MSQFQVTTELDALCGGDVTVRDEDHVGHRAAGEDDAADELAYKIERGVLIGDGHDDTDGDEEN